MYNGVQYRSRLEARWAAFFDLAGWKHEYEPIDLPGWSPDFRVTFECASEACRHKRHVLLVEIKPFFDVKQFDGHPSCEYFGFGLGDKWHPHLCCSSAQFGANPEVSYWYMEHDLDVDDFTLMKWLKMGYSEMWRIAGNKTQWKAR